MSDGLDDLDDLMTRAAATQWGKACSALWAQAAALAEERGDLDKAIICYDELATAYMMGGEITRCIAPFMWLIACLPCARLPPVLPSGHERGHLGGLRTLAGH